MAKKVKTIKKKKRKNSHVRFIIAALVFLIGTIVIVGGLAALILSESFGKFFYIPLIVVLLVDFICGIFIANSQSQVDFKVCWLTVLLCLPLIGAILYLLYAQKITTKGKKALRRNIINKKLMEGKEDSSLVLAEIKEKDPSVYPIVNKLYKQSLASIYKNTNFEYYPLGELGFPVMIEELKKAKKFIFFEYYIIESGYFFDDIYKILKEKANEGVDVRMMYDDFGSDAKINSFFYVDARKNGIQCFPFNRLRPAVDIRQNNRDHRKILVIDGVVGFSGGCNIADEYINKRIRFGKRKDNIFMLKGEAVNGLTNLFISSWMLNKRKFKEEDPKNYFYDKMIAYREDIKPTFEGYFQPFGEVPFDGEYGTRDAILQMILSSQKYCYISTPYLIPDSEIITALETAAKSGVDVRIVTPGIPDKKLVYSITRSYYANLLLNGVKIYEYTPGFNHAKIFVSDDKIAITGTTNLDFRSLYLHFEDCVLICLSPKIEKIRDDILEMVKEGKKVDVKDYLHIKFHKKLAWALLRILSPLV